ANPGKISVSARSEEIGDDVGEIDATVEGDDAKIAFNGKYLTEVLSVLREADRNLTAMRLENPLINPQNPAAVSQRLAQLEMAGKELQQRRSEYQADLDAQRQLLASVESQMNMPTELANQSTNATEATFLSPEAIRLTSLIDTADAKIAELRTVRRMTDEHPEIKELLTTRRSNMAALEVQRDRDRQLTVANGALDVRLMSLVGGAEPWRSDRARLFVQIAAQEAKIKDVDISQQANEREIAQLADVRARVFEIQDSYADITDEVGRAKREHALLADTLAKVEPALRANEQNKLLHWSLGPPARGGAVPVKPTARIVVLLALFAGVAAGAIFVVLAEVLDNIYRSAGRVSRSLGLPILDAIDEIVTSRDRRRALVRRTVVTPIVVGLCLSLTIVTGSVAYLSIQQPHTYKRVQEIPRAAFELLAGSMPPEKLPEPSSPLVES
ncbi:MAG: hypothetical protein KJ749_00675, partial [Planctomycetes bacterium]|nr:hypothetical protein [Planctomycetota bacterium]